MVVSGYCLGCLAEVLEAGDYADLHSKECLVNAETPGACTCIPYRVWTDDARPLALVAEAAERFHRYAVN